jgi:hypothetical protein
MTGKKFSQRGLMQGAAALGAAALIPEGLAQQVARSASAPGAPLPGRGELLIRGVTVLTMDPALPDLAAGDVHVREGAIIAVAPMVEAPAAQVIDNAGMICIPGFVDTHFHLWNAMKKIGVAIGLTLAFTASGQPEGTQVEYGPDDLATIITTYKQYEARFSRDFAGKKFSGIMPFYSAPSSLVGGYYISLG